ncbi:MAG: helix-turn-helix transcriptional regulator [Acidobacteriota bacterium]|nr:helix-turn-helix transcriptional regulator [Acidobacteriota bacterium]
MLRKTLKTEWKPAGYPKEFRHLGDHIRARRVESGLQIKQLAALLSADAGSVASWEGGRRKPALERLPRLLEFLEYDPRPASTTVGQQLRACREGRGLSQKAFARLLMVDAGTLRRWEQETRVPGKKQMARIAAIMAQSRRE